MDRLVIPGRFPGLNDYIKAERGNRYRAAKIKRECTELSMWCCKQQRIPKQTGPVELRITWFEPNAKRDLDNIGFAIKFVLDGMVKAGVLENDNQKWVKRIVHEAEIDQKKPRVEIEINQWEKGTE